MAIYRLHRRQWEKGYTVVPVHVQRKPKAKAKPKISQPRRSIRAERKAVAQSPAKAFLSSKTQRKGISSGLSTVVRRRTKVKGGVGGTNDKWWSKLAGTGDSSKGRLRVTA